MQSQSFCRTAHVAIIGCLLLACGSSSNSPTDGGKTHKGGATGVAGGTSISPSTGGSGGVSSVSGVSGVAGSSAAIDQAGATGVSDSNIAGASGTVVRLPCGLGGDIRCNGNVREICSNSGAWEALPAEDQCSGANPACTGNGLCAAYRLVQGTIDTFGISTSTNASGYVLVHQTLLEYPSACNQSYCVTGGIQP